MTGPHMNHVEARSNRRPARQYVSESHDHKPDAPSKAGHTVGPWFWSHRQIPGDKDGMYATQIYDCGGVTIATAAWYPIKGERYVATNRAANARLIAAAPDMRDVCAAFSVTNEGGIVTLRSNGRTIARASSRSDTGKELLRLGKLRRTALAKAEGGAA